MMGENVNKLKVRPYCTRSLPRELHSRLKVVAAQNEKSMEEMLNVALEYGLRVIEAAREKREGRG